AARATRLDRRAAPHGGHPRRCARRLLQDRGTRDVGCRPRAAADAALAAERRSHVDMLLPPSVRGAGPGAGCGAAPPARGGPGTGTGPQARLLSPADAAPPD